MARYVNIFKRSSVEIPNTSPITSPFYATCGFSCGSAPIAARIASRIIIIMTAPMMASVILKPSSVMLNYYCAPQI